MDVSQKDLISETVSAFLEKMGFSARVEILAEEEGVSCKVFVENGQNFLIGQHGVNLAAIQHLVRAIVRRKIGERINVSVDINDYFLDKRSLLEGEAKKAALEARTTGLSVALRPMLPYERKVVHSYLAEEEGIVTESIGQGEGRKIMVSPSSKETSE